MQDEPTKLQDSFSTTDQAQAALTDQLSRLTSALENQAHAMNQLADMIQGLVQINFELMQAVLGPGNPESADEVPFDSPDRYL